MSTRLLLLMGGFLAVISVSRASIVMVTTFSDIQGIPDLAGGTIVYTSEFTDSGNYIDGGGFPALVALGVSINVSGAANSSLNGTYTPSGSSAGIAFPDGVDLSVNDLAGQVPVAFDLGGKLLGLQHWLNSSSAQPEIGDAVNLADFETSPPSSPNASVVTFDGVTATSSFSTVALVPEPSASMLVALVLFAGFTRRRR
ncbi:PEP-CTERM sorting domain-containing protein [Verrucomicrobiaceae bacterium 227]